MNSHIKNVNIGLEVRYTMRAFTRAFTRASTPIDITAAEFRVLRPMGQGKLCTQSELADLAALDRPYVTSLVRKMLKRGWLETKDNDRDRRRVDLTLSKRGQEVYQKVTLELDKINRAAIEGISRKDLATFLVVAETIRDNLEMTEQKLSA